MVVNLIILEEEKELKKKLIGIDDIDIRRGFLEFWAKDEDGNSKMELSIKIDKVSSMVATRTKEKSVKKKYLKKRN